jgi:hypothetical protein
MIGTEFSNGQGMGNQLFCYVTARCIALDKGCTFGTTGKEWFMNNIHNRSGMYFMDIDLGADIDISHEYIKYYEKDERLFIPNSIHDITHGCYIAGSDEDILDVNDDTLIYGNLQSEKYFIHHSEDIKRWFKINPEFDIYDNSRKDFCIIHIRGGDYLNNHELMLKKSYYLKAMKIMENKFHGIKFIIITNDVNISRKMFPYIEIICSDIGTDYITIKNARYVILSNSSFAFFPVFTSDTIKYIIAPKYWARHNVSNGYWASEQNIYSGWNYLDRSGKLFTSKECLKELQEYKRKKFKKLSVNKRPKGIKYFIFVLIVFIKRFIYKAGII